MNIKRIILSIAVVLCCAIVGSIFFVLAFTSGIMSVGPDAHVEVSQPTVQPEIIAQPTISIEKINGDTQREDIKVELRESDKFIVSNSDTINYCYNEWIARIFTSYQPYDDMLDDEDHSISFFIHHKPTIRSADSQFNKDKITNTKYNKCVNLSYCDASYKITSCDDDGKFRSHTYIMNDVIIAHISIHGYSNQDECNEVTDYYTNLMVSKLT